MFQLLYFMDIISLWLVSEYINNISAKSSFSQFQGQILCMSRLEETVNDAEFILEAVIDEMEVKKALFESKYLSLTFTSHTAFEFFARFILHQACIHVKSSFPK
jgi:hypothetical protein